MAFIPITLAISMRIDGDLCIPATFPLSVLRARLRNATNDVKRIGRSNEASQRKVPKWRFQIMDDLRMQRTPAPYFMNGQSEMPRKRIAYDIEELDYDRSVVPMDLGKMEIEAMIQAAVEQTRGKDFFRHPDVALLERG